MNEEKRREEAILAHSIASQVAAAEGTTYQEAFQVLEHAKSILSHSMRQHRAGVPEEIRDVWGAVIEMPQADARGGEEISSQRDCPA